MNKITVLKNCEGNVSMGITDALNLAVNYSVEITDEEIEREACEYSEEAYLSYLACWNYIKSKIR